MDRRRNLRGAFSGAAAGLALLSVPLAGGAQDAAVHDPSGCLDAGAVAGSDALELFVARDARGYSVRLLTTDGRERTVHARSCAQARSAALVVVGLARAAQAADESLQRDAPPAESPVAPEAVSEPGGPRSPPERSPPTTRDRATAIAAPALSELHWHVAASGGLAVGTGVSAEGSLGGGLTVGAFRVDVAAVMRAPDAEPVRGVTDATTEVRTWLGRARTCGVLRAARSVAIGVCAVLELGALTAAAYGPGVVSQAPRTTLWAASAGGVTAAVSLGHSLALLAELDVGVAWTRPRLVVSGAGAVRSSPGYVLGARAGLELEL